jgi:hypothetical protein
MMVPIDTKKDCIFTIFEITSLKYFFRYGRIRPSGGYRGVGRIVHSTTAETNHNRLKLTIVGSS